MKPGWGKVLSGARNKQSAAGNLDGGKTKHGDEAAGLAAPAHPGAFLEQGHLP